MNAPHPAHCGIRDKETLKKCSQIVHEEEPGTPKAMEHRIMEPGAIKILSYVYFFPGVFIPNPG